MRRSRIPGSDRVDHPGQARLHPRVTDGVFAPDGSYITLPALDDEPFEKLWQKKVFVQDVNDLEFVQDPGPAEPVWSVD